MGHFSAEIIKGNYLVAFRDRGTRETHSPSTEAFRPLWTIVTRAWTLNLRPRGAAMMRRSSINTYLLLFASQQRPRFFRPPPSPFPFVATRPFFTQDVQISRSYITRNVPRRGPGMFFSPHHSTPLIVANRHRPPSYRRESVPVVPPTSRP